MTRCSVTDIPVTRLKGVGRHLASKLAKLRIESIQDLLFHLPVRYQDRTRVTPIAELGLHHEAVIQGEITDVQVLHQPRRSLVVLLRDMNAQITLRFFHFSTTQAQQLTIGSVLRCFGETRRGRHGIEMYHPEYQRIIEGHVPLETSTLTPIYSITEGISQARLRQLCATAIQWLAQSYSITEWLPDTLRQRYQLMSLPEALTLLHQPPADTVMADLTEGQHPALYRLVFEELLAHRLSVMHRRRTIKSQAAYALPANTKPINTSLGERFTQQLGFHLTSAQARVCREISADLSQAHPMLRLVQGDVGCGKTVVAALSALQALESQYQVALMVPTEILCEQHYERFTQWFTPLGIECCYFTGRLKGKPRQQSLSDIASGKAQMVIGTHALFQTDVHFHQLALVIIDEQHRFGVHQRLALQQKGHDGHLQPHQLIMTATPIPRTLAMSAYADLECSVIDELPAGRTPITTRVIEDKKRQHIIERVRHYCAAGHQAYWVCTLIEESEVLQCQAAEVTYETLKQALPSLRCALVHGRMKAEEKHQIMTDFQQGRIQVLIATTVIEVGVDVSNASLMVIENPERLGLAQLHQLRGRVGRGHKQSYCMLIYRNPLSQQGRARLQVMKDHQDGFLIAEKDLLLRGPGEILGTRQTGAMSFKIVDLIRDAALLETAQHAADQLQKEAPQAVEPLLHRWLKDSDRYALT